jgi:hypothetical protein
MIGAIIARGLVAGVVHDYGVMIQLLSGEGKNLLLKSRDRSCPFHKIPFRNRRPTGAKRE